MASAKPIQSYCDLHGHHYEQVAEAVTRKTVQQPAGVIIEHAFLCRQCGDVIRREVAFWAKYNKQAGQQPEEKF